MTDRHDRHAHWLAFDLETLRIQRRERLRAEFAAMREAFKGLGAAVNRAFAPIRELIKAAAPAPTRADYTLIPAQRHQSPGDKS